ncbi:MAG TPA: MmcQ/YjbR family DNA-binding protein [Acidimicrobiales bacterium]|nr:MmcQ/YjbR family DNA-binding protein [Acidimicrobiales bacterium]
MTRLAEARSLALGLPEAIEADHHGMPSFRVDGRIFATVPDEDHIRVMAGEDEIRAVVAEHPDVCAEMYWGKRLSCVVVDLRVAPADLLEGLLFEAWSAKAPKRLLK